MKNIENKQEFFNDLIEKAKSMPKSGHPFLDARWESEGADKRNHCYRRPYYRFCQELVRAMQPKIVVELGIDEGDCSGHFANGNPTTTVLGVDVHKDGESPSERCRVVETQFSNFKYLRGWTWQRLEDVKKYAPIDILFIDSWHEYDYMARDWNDYAPLLSDNAIVLVDDLQMGGVSTAFKELIGDLPTERKQNTKPEFYHIDTTMNPACPMGIMMGFDKNYKFNYNKQEYMDKESKLK